MNINTLTAQHCSLFEIDAELEEAFDQLQEEREITGTISNESRQQLFAELGKNLRAAGWLKYKSRRRRVFSKAIRELHGKTTANGGHRFDIQIRQGTNTDDFMLVGRLLPHSSQDAQDS